MAFAQPFTTHSAHCFFTAFPVARCLIAVTNLASSRGGPITTFPSVSFASEEQHHGEYSETYGHSNHYLLTLLAKELGVSTLCLMIIAKHDGCRDCGC
jgi:hypothetical protein